MPELTEVRFFVPARPRSTQTGRVIRVRSKNPLRPARRVPIRMGQEWTRSCAVYAKMNRPARPFDGFVAVEFCYRIERPTAAVPATLSPYPLNCADLDNLGKGPLDAFQKILYVNDKYIAHKVETKRWADERGPGVEVRVWKLAQA